MTQYAWAHVAQRPFFYGFWIEKGWPVVVADQHCRGRGLVRFHCQDGLSTRLEKAVKAAADALSRPRPRPLHGHYCNGDYVVELFDDECDDLDDVDDDYDDNYKLMTHPEGRIGDHQLVHQPDLSWKTRSHFRFQYPDSNFSGDGVDVLIDWRLNRKRGHAHDRKWMSPLQVSLYDHGLRCNAGMRPNENCVCEDYDLSCHYYLTFGGLKCEAKRKRMLRRLRRNRK